MYSASIGGVIFLRKFVCNRLKKQINIFLEGQPSDFCANKYEKAHLSMKKYCINFDFLTSDFWRAARLTSMKAAGEHYHQELGARITAQSTRNVPGSWKEEDERGWIKPKPIAGVGRRPGRWHASSHLASFKEAGECFPSTRLLPLWNITAGLKDCLGDIPGLNCYCHLPCKQLRVMSAWALLSFVLLL